MARGLEQGDLGMGRVSKGLGGQGLEVGRGLEGAGDLGGPGPWGDGRSFARSLRQTEIPPLFYKTSSQSGPLPKKDREKVTNNHIL